jgi:N-acetylglutamate synthase-like GNAT family acetyltransferase
LNRKVLTFRRASRDDAELLTALTIASKAHWGYDDAFMEKAQPDLKVTSKYLAANDCWVAEDRGKVVGWFSLVEQPSSLLLDNFFLDPACIGSGLGRQMWEQALSRAVTRGAERLTLEADPNSAGFYERMGARRAGSVIASSTGRELPRYEVDVASADKPGEENEQ